MDSHAKGDLASPLTVMDCVAAVQGVGSGQFTSRFAEEGQHFFASFYGAPFFALSRLAPEAIDRLESNLLLITSDITLAADSGRWLSLYAKAFRPTNKLNLAVCVPSKPRSLKPPKPLLFQPPQQILVKDWRKHLEALDVPPDVLIFQPLGFDDLASAADDFCRHAAGRKVLVSCATLPDALIARQLLDGRGYAIGETIAFPLSEEVPQHHAPGAWWFSATVPTVSEAKPVSPELTEPLRLAYLIFHGHLRQAKEGKDRELLAAIYATRSTEKVEDTDAVRAVRILPMGGICLSTGRFFSEISVDGDSGFHWEEKVLGADLLATAPAESTARTPDEERLALMLWLAKAMTYEARRDEPVLPDQENDDPKAAEPVGEVPQVAEMGSPSSTASATEAESSAPVAFGISTEPVDAAPAPTRSRLSRSAGTVNVLVLAALLGKTGSTSAPAFEKAKKLILDWLANKGFRSLDAAGNHHVEHADGEVTIETDDQGIWAMRFDDRRSMEDGAIWRVEVTLLGKGAAAISVRMAQVRSSEEAPPPVASGAPGVVSKIAQQIGLQDAGVALVDTAQQLKGNKDAPWFLQLLLNPNRSQPVIVVAGNVDQSADRLAKRLVGVAHVVRIDNALSENLIRSFGRDRSVYGNAVRLYRPGFTADSDPYEHPIWALKGQVLPKWLTDDLFEQACAISLEVGDVDERAPSFQAIRNLLAEGRQAASEHRLAELRRQAESLASSAEDKISQLQAINQELDEALTEQKAQNKYLLEQISQAHIELQATRRERNAALEDVRQIRYQINNQWVDEAISGAGPDEEPYYPDNWDELELWVEEYGEGKLFLHASAIKAAKESPFKDIPFAYKAMEYLVRYFIPMKNRDPDDDQPFLDEKRALEELGIEREPVGTALNDHRYKHEYKRQYDGRMIWLDDHLKWGKGFDPATLFRLYFHYDESTEKVVIGHLPTHLTNRITHSG